MSSKKLPKIVPVTCLKIFIKDFKRRYLEDGTELHLDFGLVCLQPNGAVLVFFLHNIKHQTQEIHFEQKLEKLFFRMAKLKKKL